MMIRIVFLIMMCVMVIFTAGCGGTSNDDAERKSGADDGRPAQSATNTPKQKHTTVSDSGKSERTPKTADRNTDEHGEVKIGTVLPDAFHSDSWVVYILPSSVEIENRSPYEFTCKARIVKLENADDGPFPSVRVIGERKKFTEFEFFQKNGKAHYKSKNHFGWSAGGEVRKDQIASKIYNYVTKNM